MGLVAQAGISEFIAWFSGRRTASLGHLDLCQRPAGADAHGQPAPDLRPRPHRRRRRRVARREPGRPRGRAAAARVGAALLVARSPSPRPRSMPARPRPAGPGTRGSRPSSSTPCSEARPTTRCSPGPARSAGARSAHVTFVVGNTPPDRWRRLAASVDDLRRAVRTARACEALAIVQRTRLIAILGGTRGPLGRRRIGRRTASARVRSSSDRPSPTSSPQAARRGRR